MAKDHAKETIHPPPHKKGETRAAVSASKNNQGETKRLEFDFEQYAHFLDNSDLEESQKPELLQAVWNIMSEFVMLGFGVHPLQQACGKDVLDGGQSSAPSSFLLQSDLKHLIEEFEHVAEPSAAVAEEGVDA